VVLSDDTRSDIVWHPTLSHGYRINTVAGWVVDAYNDDREKEQDVGYICFVFITHWTVEPPCMDANTRGTDNHSPTRQMRAAFKLGE
jgi:hypothetical protein